MKYLPLIQAIKQAEDGFTFSHPNFEHPVTSRKDNWVTVLDALGNRLTVKVERTKAIA